MISVNNWKFLVSLFLDKMSLEIMSDDHPSRKLALLNYKNMNFTKSRNCIFFKGVNPWFSSKTANFLCFFFDSISLEIMSDDHLVKRSPRKYKYGFHAVTILNFIFKWLSDDSLFFEQNWLWKMFDDRQVRKQALLD